MFLSGRFSLPCCAITCRCSHLTSLCSHLTSLQASAGSLRIALTLDAEGFKVPWAVGQGAATSTMERMPYKTGSQNPKRTAINPATLNLRDSVCTLVTSSNKLTSGKIVGSLQEDFHVLVKVVIEPAWRSEFVSLIQLNLARASVQVVRSPKQTLPQAPSDSGFCSLEAVAAICG